ncbi:hypothetical protein AVL63_06920 [Nesterenkonia jeotgali]|uniref:Polysaccharide pyruvyl transferase domain-containing protein n=2 Tax=Nesterenkonia jeotgali TaxID=317018 RepID=A0A0W8IE29_9MICC|nr:hypothetical protein AVL63_06920 [Nesterenkonia jeotgali]
MSMQRIFNYGSSLQAYALRRLLEGVQPHSEVSFVDYQPGPTLVNGPANRVERLGRVGRTLAKVHSYTKTEVGPRNTIRFINHKKSYAKNYFPMIGVSEVANRRPALDLQVIGSDEVFNCVQSNTRVGYSPELFGRDSRASRVVSYAGSFGSTTMDKIEQAGIRRELADSFAGFHAISVRDENSRQIVEHLTGRSPEVHVDPTLVYNFGDSTALIPRHRQLQEKYIIVYGYPGRFNEDENAVIKRYAKEINARVISFGGNQGSTDQFVDCDPFTLLAYFRDAAAVITDTFHGTIFSIINEVPFATIVRSTQGGESGNREKLSSLLGHFGLSDRILKNTEGLRELIAEPIDFKSVRALRSMERERTLAYLESVV